MLKLIITDDKQGLVWGYFVKTKYTGFGLRGELRKSLQKNICMCLYLENRDKLFGK